MKIFISITSSNTNLGLLTDTIFLTKCQSVAKTIFLANPTILTLFHNQITFSLWAWANLLLSPFSNNQGRPTSSTLPYQRISTVLYGKTRSTLLPFTHQKYVSSRHNKFVVSSTSIPLAYPSVSPHIYSET